MGGGQWIWAITQSSGIWCSPENLKLNNHCHADYRYGGNQVGEPSQSPGEDSRHECLHTLWWWVLWLHNAVLYTVITTFMLCCLNGLLLCTFERFTGIEGLIFLNPCLVGWHLLLCILFSFSSDMILGVSNSMRNISQMIITILQNR